MLEMGFPVSYTHLDVYKRQIVYGGVPIPALETQGVISLSGDRALAERFVTLFPLPSKAGGAGEILPVFEP